MNSGDKESSDGKSSDDVTLFTILLIDVQKTSIVLLWELWSVLLEVKSLAVSVFVVKVLFGHPDSPPLVYPRKDCPFTIVCVLILNRVKECVSMMLIDTKYSLRRVLCVS